MKADVNRSRYGLKIPRLAVALVTAAGLVLASAGSARASGEGGGGVPGDSAGAQGAGVATIAESIDTDPHFTPVPPPADEGPSRIPEGTDLGIRSSSLYKRRIPGPSRKGGTYIARILIKTGIRRRPRGKGIWTARTWTKWSGGTQKLMVLGSRIVKGKMWLKVRLPTRPNGRSGWLPRDRVQLSHTSRYLVIDRSQRVLKIYGHKGKRIARFKVVVGAPGTPTPIGLFALYDRVKQSNPGGFVGPWVVPLTAHSNELRRYDGGPGLVALHGRAGASFLDPLGSARSHGCVRMNNSRIRQIIRVAKGTAVRIRK